LFTAYDDTVSGYIMAVSSHWISLECLQMPRFTSNIRFFGTFEDIPSQSIICATVILLAALTNSPSIIYISRHSDTSSLFGALISMMDVLNVDLGSDIDAVLGKMGGQ